MPRRHIFFAETKVGQNHMALGIKQDVFRLQVAIDNVEAVQIAQSAGNLRGVELRSHRRKALLALQMEKQLALRKRGRW